MPSLRHEILVEVFRDRPQLICDLLAIVAGIEVHASSIDAGPNDANQITPIEFRADRVLLMRDEHGNVMRSAVLEIQLSIDPDKLRTWPLYLTAARAEHRCPPLLLVIALDATVAAWARAPIDLGHPGFELAPIVVCLEDLAEDMKRAGAERTPELSLLCALGHPDLAHAKAVFDANPGFDKERAAVYLEALYQYLPKHIARLLEAYVRTQKYEYLSEFARRYVDQGREEGREEGREKGREEAIQRAVLTLATVRLGRVPPHLVDKIQAVRDYTALEQLLERMAHAVDAAATLALLEGISSPG